MRRRSTPFDSSILTGLRILCYTLLFVLLFMVGYWIGGKLPLVLYKAPAWEEAILMEEEELLDAVRDVPLQMTNILRNVKENTKATARLCGRPRILWITSRCIWTRKHRQFCLSR